MENVIVLRSLNQHLLKKSATMLKCTCKLAYSIIEPKNYYPLFKKLCLQKNFHFIKCGLQRKATKYDYAIAVKYNLQNWFKNHDPQQSFMYGTTGPEFEIMSSLCWNGHSGFSFGCSMHDLQYIFKNGYYAFYFKYI